MKVVCGPCRTRSSARAIDQANATLIRSWLNSQHWDGILLGNLDLLGPELLPAASRSTLHRAASRGFCARALPTSAWPESDRYRLVAASAAVRSALVNAGLPTSTASVVYPGVRSELFGVDQVGMPTPLAPMAAGNAPSKCASPDC